MMELAAELMRCLRYAFDKDDLQLLHLLEDYHPPGSVWDDLKELLETRPVIDEVIKDLDRQFEHPVPMLITLLDVAVPPDASSCSRCLWRIQGAAPGHSGRVSRD